MNAEAVGSHQVNEEEFTDRGRGGRSTVSRMKPRSLHSRVSCFVNSCAATARMVCISSLRLGRLP